MKTVAKIIELLRGSVEGLHDNYIKLESSGFMPLSIEYVGRGPNGYPLVSVMHFFVQNGDVMRDPDMEFEVTSDGAWHAISYRQDSAGIVQEATWVEDGRVLVNPKLGRELKAFAKLWDRNLAEQGFLAAAEEQAKGGA